MKERRKLRFGLAVEKNRMDGNSRSPLECYEIGPGRYPLHHMMGVPATGVT